MNILEEEIDKTAFLTLTEEMLKELVPKIGLRSKFYSKLLTLKENENKTAESGTISHDGYKYAVIIFTTYSFHKLVFKQFNYLTNKRKNYYPNII